MKIGVTERGDAGIDFSWYDKLDSVSGAIIITKKISDAFIDKILTASKPIILHCTCTGWGNTWVEPNVHDYKSQIDMLGNLLTKGFPPKNVVLRVDPIIPTTEGIEKACNVLKYASEKVDIKRVRISVLDEYRHVKSRLQLAGHNSFYPGNSLYATKEMIDNVVSALTQFPFIYETCAEDFLSSKSNQFMSVGCVSDIDLKIMGIDMPSGLLENMQNRRGCHCLSCKKELLTNKSQCPHKCIYCYWQSNY